MSSPPESSPPPPTSEESSSPPESSPSDSSPPPPSPDSSENSPPPPDSGNGNDNNNDNNNNNNGNDNSNSNDNNNSNGNENNNSNGNDGNGNGNNNSNGNDNNNSNSNDNNNSNGNDNNNSNNNHNNSNNNDNGNYNSSSPPPPPPPISSSGDSPFPPPPPRSSLSGKHKSHSSSPTDSDGISDNEKAIIAGVAAGSGLLLLVIIALIFCCCCKKKKKRPRDQMPQYYNPATAGGGNNYFPSGQNMNGNWHNGQSTEHVVQMSSMPPPPGPPSGPMSSEYGWPLAPPPPPPMMNSSNMSSAAFSGPHQPAMAPPPPTVALGFNQSSFTYNDLANATGGFSQANLLGQGGFGYVHKGVLPNGKEIAVKSLKSNSGQGEREFQAEVEIISRVHHRHLVSLVGYCIAGQQRMLVYEFVPNGTLEYHLHGAGRPVMDFQTRLRIALGSAKGFAYLHEDCHPRIIHRDIKVANILLDDNFEAKVADFGLAKLSADNNTHVSTRIMGTFGYLAPEYASSGKLTEKSDVYSYGVVLLELITGRRPINMNTDDDEDTLVDWARPFLTRAAEGGSYEGLIDPRLEDNYDAQEMKRMVICAGASIRHSARRRPKMSQIVRALEGDVSLDDLSNLGGGNTTDGGSTAFGSGSSSDYDLKRFAKSPGMSSQEFSSGEHGMTANH